MLAPVQSLVGGVLIGASAAILLLGYGRIAGISGILGGALGRRELDWRLSFLAGLAGGGVLFGLMWPASFSSSVASPAVLVTAGLLVGFGTRLGSGCTSGHGVCGLGRLSPRSLVATLTFMATGAITVFVARHVLP